MLHARSRQNLPLDPMRSKVQRYISASCNTKTHVRANDSWTSLHHHLPSDSLENYIRTSHHAYCPDSYSDLRQTKSIVIRLLDFTTNPCWSVSVYASTFPVLCVPVHNPVSGISAMTLLMTISTILARSIQWGMRPMQSLWETLSITTPSLVYREPLVVAYQVSEINILS